MVQREDVLGSSLWSAPHIVPCTKGKDEEESQPSRFARAGMSLLELLLIQQYWGVKIPT